MHDDALSTWFSAPNFNRETLESIRNLVRIAAYVVGAEASFLVLEDDQSFDVPVQHGTVAAYFCESDELVLGLLAIAINQRGLISWPSRHWFRRGPHDLQSLIAVPIHQGTHRIGLLAVCDEDRLTISRAQGYILTTLAAEIESHLELQYLRRWYSDQVVSGNSIDTRLRLLESVVVNANDAVLVTEAEPIDRPGPRIIYANAAFTRMTGYTCEEVLGLTPRILQGPLTDASSRSLLRDALRQWKPIEVELLNYRKDGSIFWVELSIAPVANETGLFTHWVSVQRDVTERKLL